MREAAARLFRDLTLCREAIRTSTGVGAPSAFVEIETRVMYWHVQNPDYLRIPQEAFQHIINHHTYSQVEIMDWVLWAEQLENQTLPASQWVLRS